MNWLVASNISFRIVNPRSPFTLPTRDELIAVAWEIEFWTRLFDAGAELPSLTPRDAMRIYDHDRREDPSLWDDIESILAEVVLNRRGLSPQFLAVLGERWPRPMQSLPNGRWMLFDPYWVGFHGFCVDDRPQVYAVSDGPVTDLWAACIRSVPVRASYRNAIVCWIPASRLRNAQDGMQFALFEPVHWADDPQHVGCPASMHLKSLGLLG